MQPQSRPLWLRQPERGSHRLMQLIARLTLLLGRPVGRALLYPICAYFLAFSPRARCASSAYLAKVLGRAPRWRDLFRHYYCFATTVLDRTYLLAGRSDYFDCHAHNVQVLLDTLAEGHGCLLFGAHFGSFDVLRVLGAARCPVPIKILMHEQNAEKLNSVLRALNPQIAAQVIVLGRPQTMLQVAEALDRGEVVGLLADRVVAGEKFQPCGFLDSDAPFPEGPMLLAAALKAPVILFAAVFRGGRRYDLRFESFAERVELPRSERGAALKLACARYAAWLEANCRAAPYNWFNFYDFWSHETRGI